LELLRPDHTVLFQLGVQYNPAVEAGQWWRIVMAVFLHLGIIHLLFNSYVLWICGQAIEEEFGGRLMFLIYMASGILGFVASYFADIGGAGASGAISGLMGAVLVRRWLVDGNFSHPTTRYVLSLIGITVIFSLVVPNINAVAHGVGFAVGAGMAWVLTRVKIGRYGAIGIALLTVAISLGTVASFVSMGLALTRGGPEDFLKTQRCWQEVQTIINDYTPSMPVNDTISCLKKAPSLEADENEAREGALRALERLEAAKRPLDVQVTREAREQLKSAFIAFVHWREVALPRYGLTPVR